MKRLMLLLIAVSFLMGAAHALAEEQILLIAPWVDDNVLVFRCSETEGLRMYERNSRTEEETLRINYADTSLPIGFAASPETLSYYYIQLNGLYRSTVELHPSGEIKGVQTTRIADLAGMEGKTVQAVVVDNWYVYIDPDTNTIQRIELP